jgi:hypothetical protein
MSIEEVYDILKISWTENTCYPACKSEWSESEPYVGQCAVTSLLVQDLFGGHLLFHESLNHYYNLLPNEEIVDLTKDQFDQEFDINNYVIVSREKIFNKKRENEHYTYTRYSLLKMHFENNSMLRGYNFEYYQPQ